MKLKYCRDSQGKKKYTLKESINKVKTEDAHYKFIKIKNAIEN